jgi:hypothetical protein
MGYLRDNASFDPENKERTLKYGVCEKEACREPACKEDCCLFPRHPNPQKILLECGCKPQDACFEVRDRCCDKDQFFVLDSVLVDTTCLCRPQVKLEFSSLVYFKADADHCMKKEIEIDLLFELIKVCPNKSECVQSWRYLKEFEVGICDKLELEISEPFTVTFCDKTCPECCEYKMIVKGRKFEGDICALRITKPDLSALAQGICGD